MPSLLALIVYVALFGMVTAGLYTAWTGIKEHISAPYIAAQLKADQTKIDASEKRATDAEGASKRANDDTTACKAAQSVQSDAVKGWKARSDAAVAETAKLRAAQKKQDADTQAYIDRKTVEAMAATNKHMTCQEELGKARATLIEALKRRGIGATPVVPK